MPPSDEAENLNEEFIKALGEKNYVRATRIARLMNRPEEELWGLKENALRQFIVEYRNPEGVQALIREYGFPVDKLERLAKNILHDIERGEAFGKSGTPIQFDVGSMRFLSLEEWIEKYISPRK